MSHDFKKFYDLETYLFSEVADTFGKTGKISTTDFFMIIIWKSNRAKTTVKKTLSKNVNDFAEAVEQIAKSLSSTTNNKRRLYILMHDWGLRLPMATAILTVLFSDDFTVYDVRVCNELDDFHKLDWWIFSDKLWDEYVRFVEAVRAKTPQNLSLRDKDRYLWGRSFFEQAQADAL